MTQPTIFRTLDSPKPALRFNATFSLAFVTSLSLFICTLLSAWAGKGGKGKPGGGGDPSLPALVEPFAQYRVTWFQLPPEMGDSLILSDVNRDGVAVGRYHDTDGFRHGIWADSEGNYGDLDDVFADALLQHQNYRFAYAFNINAAGKIAAVLVPEEQLGASPNIRIVVGDLASTPPTITTVMDSIYDSKVPILDMNEGGDLLVVDGTDSTFWLHRAPYTGLPEKIEFVSEREPIDWTPTNLNDVGQILIDATFVELVPISRKKTEERDIHYAYRMEPDGALTELGRSLAGQWLGRSLAQDGSVYGTNYTSNLSLSSVPERWTLEQGWTAISPLPASHTLVSKAISGAVEVAIRGTNQPDHVVYREGWGPYRIEITEGIEEGDVDLWHQGSGSPLSGISRPNSATTAGFICGWDPFIDANPGWIEASFILTPISPTQ